MNFLYPQFLWALAALSIPLIIHLFNFRRYVTVYFSDTRLLKNVVKQSKAINRLKQFLIMLARMLALAMLVIAFAYPYIPAQVGSSDARRYASVYVDNSPSMSSSAGQSSPLAEARNRAVEIIKGLPQQYRVQVITNSLQGRQQRFYTRQEAIELIDGITPSYAYRTMSQIRDRIEAAAENASADQLDLFVLSDLQKTAFEDFENLDEDWRLQMIPLGEDNNRGNIAVDSAWFDKPVLQPGFDQDLVVKISNRGADENREVSLQLEVEDALQGAKTVSIPANGSEEVNFALRTEETGSFRAKISVDAPAPYFDNQLFISYRVSDPFRILMTGQEEFSERFAKLYNDSIYNFRYQNLTGIDYSQLSEFDLIIVDHGSNTLPGGFTEALQQHLQNGGNLVVFPPQQEASAVNSLLNRLGVRSLGNQREAARAAKIYYDDPFFTDVFTGRPQQANLPSSQSWYSYSDPKAFPLIDMGNGEPMAVRIPLQNGSLILATTSLESSNISSHPIFVPLMLNAALYSRQQTSLYTLSGNSKGPVYEAMESERPLVIRSGEDNEIIPRQRSRNRQKEIYDLSPDLKPGTYPVYQDEQALGYVALNPRPEESRWEFYEAGELARELGLDELSVLEASTESLQFSIAQRYEGTPLWKWCVAAALLFLLLEIALIKLWK